MEGVLDLISWLLPTGLFIIILFLLNNQFNNVWKKQKVPCLERKFIFGNVYSAFTLKVSLGQLLENIHRKAGDKPYIGFYSMNQPVILIKEPGIIKNILVKDFNNFRHHNFNLDEKVDPTGPGNIFFNSSPRWKIIRTKITSIFTTSKIKYMYSLMAEVAEDLFKKISSECDGKGILNVPEVNAQYTTDIISSVVLGFKANCLVNSDSVYRQIGKKSVELTAKRGFQIVTLFLTPALANFLRFKSNPEQLVDMLKGTFLEMVKYREENNVQRNDLIGHLSQLLKEINAEDGSIKENSLTYEEIIGVIVSFFVAGFETTASTMSYTLYELALNQDYQDQLRSEFKQALIDNKGKITYESLQDIKFLDWCVSETLRKYPVLGFLDRKCVSDYKVPGHDLVIPAGALAIISLNGLQRDPKYFPEPEKYDPYRFSDERKDEIVPFTYMPFGEGPRTCIGMRFGLISAKAGLFHILKDFKVLPCDETPVPIQFDALSPLNTPKDFKLPLKFVAIR